MNIAEAKKIHIRDFLERMGYQPEKVDESKGEYWYLSPFRNEKTASFHVWTATKGKVAGQVFFKDHGSGETGDIVELARRLSNNQTVSEALKLIRERCGAILATPLLDRPKQSNPEPDKCQDAPSQKPHYTILKQKPLKNPFLCTYVEGRQIPRRLWAYLAETYYTDKHNRRFFAVSWTNESGATEISAPLQGKSFKTIIGEKDLTIHRDPLKRQSGLALVFESQWDFLSYLTLTNQSQADGCAFVLNSGNLARKAANIIKGMEGVRTVVFYDHWDDAGQNSFDAFCQEMHDTSIQVLSAKYRYEGFKDLNDWHKANPSAHWNQGQGQKTWYESHPGHNPDAKPRYS